MPEASELEIECAVIDRRTEGLQELELSVERLKPGDYGMCEDWGTKISPGRLNAPPSASRCTRRQERGDK